MCRNRSGYDKLVARQVGFDHPVSAPVGPRPTEIASRVADNREVLQPTFAAQGGASLAPGVFSELRFDGNLLRPSAAGTPIAVHRGRAWQAEGRSYARMDCVGRVLVYFGHLDGTLGPLYGPFDSLAAVDGVIYADRERFAEFDEAASLWAIEHTALRCPVLVARAPD